MQKFVIYLRLSKEDKKRTQHGFDAQLASIHHYLDTTSHEVVGHEQEFVSGAADDKPALYRAMALCKETGAVLIVAKLDRLSRRVAQIATYMESPISFRVASMPRADNFQLHLYSALAEQEREVIRDRVKQGLKAAKAKGVKIGAASPLYGSSSPEGVSPNKKRQSSAKAKAEMYRAPLTMILATLKGSVRPTYRVVAGALTEACIQLPSGVVGEWKASQVKRVVDRLEMII